MTHKVQLICSVSMCVNLVYVRFNLGHYTFHPYMKKLWLLYLPFSAYGRSSSNDSEWANGIVCSRLFGFLPLVPTRSPQHAERSRSTLWRQPQLGSSRRRPAGSSVVQAGPWPSPWWCHPSEPPGWGEGWREVSEGRTVEGGGGIKGDRGIHTSDWLERWFICWLKERLFTKWLTKLFF